jgi:hypothetical protein
MDNNELLKMDYNVLESFNEMLRQLHYKLGDLNNVYDSNYFIEQLNMIKEREKQLPINLKTGYERQLTALLDEHPPKLWASTSEIETFFNDLNIKKNKNEKLKLFVLTFIYKRINNLKEPLIEEIEKLKLEEKRKKGSYILVNTESNRTKSNRTKSNRTKSNRTKSNRTNRNTSASGEYLHIGEGEEGGGGKRTRKFIRTKKAKKSKRRTKKRKNKY